LKKVIVAPQAEQDLIEISDYIENDNPVRAESFVREIFGRFSLIAERPKSYPARDDLFDGMRSCLHGKYHILFIEYDSHVRIVRVTHGSRDLGHLHFGDDL
jgi:toxin ParE1/3/4